MRSGIALLVLLCVTGPVTTHATTGILSIINTTTLTANHTGQIRIGANNLTLDCAGHQITYKAGSSGGCGTTGTSTCGIHAGNRTGITIKNCVVRGAYDYGMWIEGTTTTVRDSSVSRSEVGFRVDGASNVLFINSTAVANGAGFEIRASTNVRFTHTHAIHSAGDGFDINDSTDTRIQYAVASGNGVNGIEFDDSSGSSVLHSIVEDNGQHGVSLDNSTGVSIRANEIYGNTGDGLRFQNCDNGTIRTNQADSNGGCDADQDAASTGNSWTGNMLQNVCGTVPIPN